jgi:hypothetical protein
MFFNPFRNKNDGQENDRNNPPSRPAEDLIRRLGSQIQGAKWKEVDKLLHSLSKKEISALNSLQLETQNGVISTLLQSGAPESIINRALISGFSLDAPLLTTDQNGNSTTFSALHCAASRYAGGSGHRPVDSPAWFEGFLARDEARQLLEVQDSRGRTPLHGVLELSTVDPSQKWECARALLRSGSACTDIPAELFRGADLSHLTLPADLTGKDLRDANLIGADLSRLTLHDVEHHRFETPLQGAWYDNETTFPPHVIPQVLEMRKGIQAWSDGAKYAFTAEQIADLWDKAETTFQYAGACGRESLEYQKRDRAEPFGVAGLSYVEAFKAFIYDDEPEHGRVVDEFVLRSLRPEYGPDSHKELLTKIELEKEGMQYGETYPYITELLVLARDPRLLSQPDNKSTKLHVHTTGASHPSAPISLAVSSIMGWGPEDAVSSTLAIYNWGRIGQIAREFSRYKFLTRANIEGETLLEHMGYSRVNNRASDYLPSGENNSRREHDLGPGFELTNPAFSTRYIDGNRFRELDTSQYIEMRRAYIIISSEDDGTLIIRNSSHEFGRDTLPFVAGWSPKGIDNGFTREELQGLDRKTIRREFTSALSPDLNVPIFHEAGERWIPEFPEQDKINHLLTELGGLRSCMSDWLFNTNRETAWSSMPDPDGNTLHRLTGLFRSPGFEALVDGLNDYLTSVKSISAPPALRLIPKDLPPLTAIPFEDHLGFLQESLPINYNVLNTLNHLVEHGWDQDRVTAAGLDGLFRQALDTQSDLIVWI